MINDDSGGVTVETCIVSQHRYEMFALISNVTGTAGARDNDDRTDIAQLTCDTPGQKGFMLSLACRPFRTGTEDNSVKGLVRTRNVDLVYSWMVTKVGAFGRSSVH